MYFHKGKHGLRGAGPGYIHLILSNAQAPASCPGARGPGPLAAGSGAAGAEEEGAEYVEYFDRCNRKDSASFWDFAAQQPQRSNNFCLKQVLSIFSHALDVLTKSQHQRAISFSMVHVKYSNYLHNSLCWCFRAFYLLWSESKSHQNFIVSNLSQIAAPRFHGRCKTK